MKMNYRVSPISFSKLMVQALLNGTKEQTRRIINPQPIDDTDESGYVYSGDRMHLFKNDMHHPDWKLGFADLCPYGLVGDVLKVKEPHRILTDLSQPGTDPIWVEYTAGVGEGAYAIQRAFARNQLHPDTLNRLVARRSGPKRWVQGRYLPNDLIRIYLKIKEVRVERLQDISEVDAQAEGAERGLFTTEINPTPFWIKETGYSSYTDGFQFIWHTIHGPESWDADPFVWVLKFEIIEKPADLQGISKPAERLVLA